MDFQMQWSLLCPIYALTPFPDQEHPQWIPERDDPRYAKFMPQPSIDSHPLWKEKSAYIFDEDTRLSCRMDQAKALTKTIVVEGLTPQVEVPVGWLTIYYSRFTTHKVMVPLFTRFLSDSLLAPQVEVFLRSQSKSLLVTCGCIAIQFTSHDSLLKLRRLFWPKFIMAVS